MAEDKKTKVTAQTDLGLEPVSDWGDLELSTDTEFLGETREESSEAFSGIEDTISSLQSINQSRLRGEVSGDVAEQLRAQSAETALAGGISTESPAARSLQARDFGLTSMQIQEAGIQTQKDIASMQSNLAQLRESRYQFQENMKLDREKMMEQSRQFGASLEQDALRTQIANRELILKRDSFNADQNLRAVELITNLGNQQASLQVQAATSGRRVDMDPVNKIFNDLISSINDTLKTSNA